jgi:hypothetical protein
MAVLRTKDRMTFSLGQGSDRLVELDNTLLQDQVMDGRVECEVTDGSGVSYEEACKLGGDGVNTSEVAVDVSDPVLNKDCNTEEASTFSESKSLQHRLAQLLLGQQAPSSFWGLAPATVPYGSCCSAISNRSWSWHKTCQTGPKYGSL